MSAKDRYLMAVAKDRDGREWRVADHHRQCAKAVLRKGKPIGEALVAAGYSETQSKKGMGLVKRIKALGIAFREETRLIEAEQAEGPLVPNNWNARETLIVDRLEKNIKAGKDDGVMSCKLLGSHKALNLWHVDSVTGTIIINAVGMTPFPTTIPEDPE